MVGLPCGNQYVKHAQYVVRAIPRDWSHENPICGAHGCTARHGRRESLEAAVQADPELSVRSQNLKEGRTTTAVNEGKSYASLETKIRWE